VIAAVAIAWALYLVRQVLVLIYVSVLLAIGFGPLVRLVERQTILQIGTRVPRWLAILIVYLGSSPWWPASPSSCSRRSSRRRRSSRATSRSSSTACSATSSRTTCCGAEELRRDRRAGAPATDVVGTAILTFWGLFGGMLGVVSIVILTFYLLVDSEGVFTAIVRLFPRGRRLRVHAVSRQIATKVSAWLVGQLILAGVIGASSALWLGLLGIPYFYVLALIAAVGEMIRSSVPSCRRSPASRSRSGAPGSSRSRRGALPRSSSSRRTSSSRS
jgi:hypothetical protein